MSYYRRVAVLLFSIICSSLRAGESSLPVQLVDHDGKELQARLTPDRAGGLRLESEGVEWPLNRVRRLRFPRADNPPLLLPVLQTISLRDQQQVSAAFQGLDGERLLIRTAWADALALPRAAMERITHPSDWLPAAVEDFEGKSAGWTLTGDLLGERAEATSGKHCLRLNRTGQSAAFRLAKPLAAGRMTVNVHLPKKRGAGVWFVELTFGDMSKTQVVRVELEGPGKEYAVAVPGKATYRGAVPRAEGWHWLQVEFTADRLLLLIDEYVLWSGPRRQIPGPLSACKFFCDKAAAGEILLDDFALLRAHSAAEPMEPGDATQDAIVSLEGDESFGRVLLLRGLKITQKGMRNDREHDWRTVREVRFRREGLAARETAGDHVRVRLRTNNGGRDEIEGAIQRFDGAHLTLQHAYLGELRLPVARIDELRPVFQGRRVRLESAPRHLGLSSKAGFAVERGEGEVISWPLKLESAPGAATLVIEAAFVPANGLSAFVNGKRVAHLSRLVDRPTWESKWLRVPLAKDALAAGANKIDLGLPADRETGRARDCEIRSVWLELPKR